MSFRVGALALAASLLTTAPAVAQHDPDRAYKGVPDPLVAPLLYAHHKKGYRLNRYGQSREEVRFLKRDARRACRAAIHQEAKYIGFYDVDIERGRRVRQIGPRGFEVVFAEVEFEGRRRDFVQPVSCIVRRGRVRDISGIPQPRRGGKYYKHNRVYY